MKTTFVNSGNMSFDFSNGYAPGCVLKKYCSSWGIWKEAEEDNMDINWNEDELSF